MDGAGGSKHSTIWAGWGGGRVARRCRRSTNHMQRLSFALVPFRHPAAVNGSLKSRSQKSLKSVVSKQHFCVTFTFFLFCLSLFASQFGTSGLWVCGGVWSFANCCSAPAYFLFLIDSQIPSTHAGCLTISRCERGHDHTWVTFKGNWKQTVQKKMCFGIKIRIGLTLLTCRVSPAFFLTNSRS